MGLAGMKQGAKALCFFVYYILSNIIVSKYIVLKLAKANYLTFMLYCAKVQLNRCSFEHLFKYTY